MIITKYLYPLPKSIILIFKLQVLCSERKLWNFTLPRVSEACIASRAQRSFTRFLTLIVEDSKALLPEDKSLQRPYWGDCVVIEKGAGVLKGGVIESLQRFLSWTIHLNMCEVMKMKIYWFLPGDRTTMVFITMG